MDDLIKIKDRAWESFCRLPGVHAVGIGKKVKGGVRTEQVGLTVFVTRKLPPGELSAAALVPPVFEGVDTDIVESPIPRALDALPITVVEEAIPSGKKFTFNSVDPPPKGVRLVLSVVVHIGAGS